APRFCACLPGVCGPNQRATDRWRYTIRDARSACVDHFTKCRVALWDFNRLCDEITESEWIAWFSRAFEEEPRDLDTLKRHLAVEHDNQEWVLKDEGKVVVGLMVKAAKPWSPDGVTKSDTPSAPARKPAACLKQKSTAPKWNATHKARPTANVFDLGPNHSIEAGATVAGIAVVENLLLDWGANVNVTYVGLITALEKADVATQVVAYDTPTALYPYGKKT
ncbi:hypothetical protein DYB32_010527, partial [Aphanomyces invadans]